MTDLGNAIATQDQKRQEAPITVARFITGMAPELQRALPRHLSGDRLLRIATTLIRQSDLAKQKKISKWSLSDCTPESFSACLLSSAALGLEPGVNGQAWVIPYEDRTLGIIEATLQIGYQGVIELAYRHPLVRVVTSGVIYETDPEIDDQPLGSLLWSTRVQTARFKRPPEGDPLGYWARTELTTGGVLAEALSADSVANLRGGKIGPSGKIKDPQRWMERKTVVKQVLKTAPRSVEAHWAHVIDEQGGNRLYVEQIPQQIMEQVQNQPEIEVKGADDDQQ